VQRLYQEERLMVRKRTGRKSALGLPAPLRVPDNACSSLDFIHDQIGTAAASAFSSSSTIARASVWVSCSTRRSRVPAWRGSLTASSLGAANRRRVLSDNGTELTSNAIHA
jgi:putative transposase